MLTPVASAAALMHVADLPDAYLTAPNLDLGAMRMLTALVFGQRHCGVVIGGFDYV
jgi:hypothetical protein